ncbi:MAG: DUF4139 domain-containing protein [Alphaproteobacteria bacterium]|nr:DUF4139 domain-containing protein [Alphaproteobacteria bacterium]
MKKSHCPSHFHKKKLLTTVITTLLIAGGIGYAYTTSSLSSKGALVQETGSTLIPAKDTLSTSIVLYQTGRGFIRQTRSATLDKGLHNITFGKFPTGMLFSSATISGKNIFMQTRSFDSKVEDFSLYERAQESAIGKEITLLWSVWKEGELTQIKKKAKLVAVENKVPILLIDGVLQKGTDAQILYPMADENVLQKQAGLNFTVVSDTNKPQDITLSYLTDGFSWSTTYDLYMNETNNTLSLKGYVNLLNTTNINFDNANIDFVLGDINQIRGTDPYIQKETARCEIKNFTGVKLASSPTTVNGKEPQEDKTTYPVEKDETTYLSGTFRNLGDTLYSISPDGNIVASNGHIIGHSAQTAERYDLKDYYVYRLPFKVNLKSNIPVQSLFLQKDKINFTKEYIIHSNMNETGSLAPNMILSFENNTDNELGVPLSQGVYRVFNDKQGESFFVGEGQTHTFTAMGQKVEVNLGKAFDVYGNKVQLSENKVSDVETTETYEISIQNESDEPRLIKMVQFLKEWGKTALLKDSTLTPKQTTVNTIKWEFELQPHEKKNFTYTLSITDEELVRKKQEAAIEKEKMVAEEMRLKAEKERMRLEMLSEK